MNFSATCSEIGTLDFRRIDVLSIHHRTLFLKHHIIGHAVMSTGCRTSYCWLFHGGGMDLTALPPLDARVERSCLETRGEPFRWRVIIYTSFQ